MTDHQVVHDNGSNVSLAVSLGKWPDVACFGHTLQLSVRAGLNITAISQMVAVVRKIVAHFKHSALATTSLKSKQASLKIILKLIMMI